MQKSGLDVFQSLSCETIENQHAAPPPAFEDLRESILPNAEFDRAQREICQWPNYRPTDLVSLPGLSRAAEVGQIFYKDEASRFGLDSFKALGGAYAVFRLLAAEVAKKTDASEPTSNDLRDGRFNDLTATMTVCSATDGNHGRAVAWGARLFGCRCVIFVHADVTEARIAAIAGLGAEVRQIQANYDDTVRAADKAAAENGWWVVSDTSYVNYTKIPSDVMQGYRLIVDEALEQLPDPSRLTHVFVQGGVGALAAAVVAQLSDALSDAYPRVVIVEPETAACLFDSGRAGAPTAVEGDLKTIMAGLSCGEPSLLGWQLLSPGAAAFMKVGDDAAEATMRLLALPPFGDAPLVAGESAVAGLAGFILARQSDRFSALLGLNENSQILVIGTEGATDPTHYAEIVGQSASAVVSTG